MYLAFSDDSKQNSPSIQDMGPMVAVGAILLDAEVVNEVDSKLNAVCKKYSFPPREPFKWSPGRELWMRDNLVGEKRKEFYIEVISALKENSASIIICAEDRTKQCAIPKIANHEMDVTILLLERINNYLGTKRSSGLVLVDRPPGSREDEDKFLFECASSIQEGTTYVQFSKILHNIVLSPSKSSRLIQAADLVVSSTLARICGESSYSPDLFDKVKEMLVSSGFKTHGVGLKLHPDFCYMNLYHWLLGEEYCIRGMKGIQFPVNTYPYTNNPYFTRQ